jgi:hypothetical protein
MYTDILGVSPVSTHLLFEDEKKSTIFTTHKMRREEGRASITLPPMADTVADEVDDVVMRRDEGGFDGELSCYAMGCCSGCTMLPPCCCCRHLLGAPTGGVLAGTFAGRKNVPWEPVVPWELF